MGEAKRDINNSIGLDSLWSGTAVSQDLAKSRISKSGKYVSSGRGFYYRRDTKNGGMWSTTATKTKPKILSPIHAVPKKNGKFRLVIDMRYLNSHLMVPKFKMEGLETLASMVEKGDHMFMVDLQDDYHMNMAQNALP